MPMLRTIKIAAIAVSMVNPVRSLGGKSAAACTVKVIRREAEVAAALMIFGNSGRRCVPAIDTREGNKRGDPDHMTSCLGLAKFVTTDVSRPTGQLLMTLNEAVAEGFSYKWRSSRGTQTPDETLNDGSGTLAGLRRRAEPAVQAVRDRSDPLQSFRPFRTRSGKA
jgi:hypothetical protein